MSDREAENEAKRIAYEFQKNCSRGQIMNDSIKFCEFAKLWFKHYAADHLRPKTYSRYVSVLPAINKAIGHIRLRDLRLGHLLQFYESLQKSGIRRDQRYAPIIDFNMLLQEKNIAKKDFVKDAQIGYSTLKAICNGKNVVEETAYKISAALGLPLKKLFRIVSGKKELSNATILIHHRVISSILSTAEAWEYIDQNPCRKVKPPKIIRSTAKYLDEKEARDLLDALVDEDIKYRSFIVLLLFTGMRRGEALGLEWKDIDFENNVIHICRTSQYIPSAGTITDETKNSSSNRSIKVPYYLMEELRELQKQQDEWKEKLGDRWEEHNRLFTQPFGKPMNPDTINKWFKDFLQRHNLPEITPHSLRHTNATLQIANNVPLTTVAGRLGHATPATTTKIYSHEIKSADAVASDVLENLLYPIKNDET